MPSMLSSHSGPDVTGLLIYVNLLQVLALGSSATAASEVCAGTFFLATTGEDTTKLHA